MRHANPTSEELLTLINQRASGHMDVLVPYGQLNCELTEQTENSVFQNDIGGVTFKYDLGTAVFHSHAIRQLFNRINLSTSYWKRLQSWDAYQLMVDNFQFCSESTANEISLQPRSNDPTFLLRLDLNPTLKTSIEEKLQDEDNEDENNFITLVRGVLSSNYSKFDDKELFPLLIDLLDEDENISYTMYEYDHYLTRLHVKFNNTEREYEGDIYHAGMIITNSEIGVSSIWIEPSVYKEDLLFSNRDSLKKQQVQMKVVHRGDINTEKISTILSTSSEIAQIGIIQLIESFQQEIEPELAISLIKNIIELPSRISLVLSEEWEDQDKLKKSEVTTTLLDMARSLPAFQRSKVEQAAGKMLGLFNDYRSRMSQVMEDLDGN